MNPYKFTELHYYTQIVINSIKFKVNNSDVTTYKCWIQFNAFVDRDGHFFFKTHFEIFGKFQYNYLKKLSFRTISKWSHFVLESFKNFGKFWKKNVFCFKNGKIYFVVFCFKTKKNIFLFSVLNQKTVISVFHFWFSVFYFKTEKKLFPFFLFKANDF